ncbi:nuclear pore complex protein GP210 isoform X3 [Glycine max]|uniref:Uncharacterized protein n=1 Tax=Glycine max TaxID=3847 RepID=A0A0R0G5K4_SOYBN|nr:nuclear pore complex protein GP210 isoform X3 [Glycine max]XP_014623707.1 nuclear pore complex protein GP210 isoform X3 [Glycine max]XP_040865422.1 nuclear pore complex protein GP210 isoform X3 [Glycine max]XP_040865423.1 nuclear pore complex protein GP210 isoform X3 [Glycine max]XP_040865424.1 nuclear pore complex protein GP210 isoform X3 [Glycine max]XP_040865425.1 nuclear pore complex protein GP210 isoform X3 [Glycine max]XP_040865426.1 nuclear pore complex protein GP210 isoform X3 [Gly|eukprot:XP_006598157.1 nuclear pore complex protein GP210 isoform X7 [Glycine max]
MDTFLELVDKYNKVKWSKTLVQKYQEKVASKSKKKSNNLACIQAKDRTTGRTEIASCVKVVEIRVGAHIYPQNPVLHIGSPFNLSIKGLSDTVSGQWFTTNGSVISVDTLSGMAKAIGEGCAQDPVEADSCKEHLVPLADMVNTCYKAAGNHVLPNLAVKRHVNGKPRVLTKETRHGRSAHRMSSTSLRKKSS